MLEGDGLASTEPPALPSSSTLLGNTMRSMQGTYHAVSPKGLPRYLAKFSYWFNHRFRSELCFLDSPMSPCAFDQWPSDYSSWLRLMRNKEEE